MTKMKDLALEVVNELGLDCTYQEAESWVKQRYGKGEHLGDSTFYGVRNDIRRKREQEKSAPLSATITVIPNDKMEVVNDKMEVVNDVTYNEMSRLVKVAREEFGSLERIKVVLKCLEELGR